MVNATIAHYVTLSFDALNGKWPSDRVSSIEWTDPLRIDFVIDENIEADVDRIVRENQTLVCFSLTTLFLMSYLIKANTLVFQSSLINCKLTHFAEFGKGVLKVYGTHPDAFVQAAIQLAYYRLHRK